MIHKYIKRIFLGLATSAAVFCSPIVSHAAANEVNVTVPSNIKVVLNEDGTNTINPFTIQNNMLVPITINQWQVSTTNGWSLVDKTVYDKDSKVICFTINGQNLVAGNNVSNIAVTENTSKTLPIVIKRGTWSKSQTAQSAFGLTVNYAIGQKDFTAVLDKNGATETVTNLTAKNGATVVLPTVTKDGYTFSGWQDTKGTLHTGNYVMPVGGVTLTATWTPIVYENKTSHWASGFQYGDGNNIAKTLYRIHEDVAFSIPYNSTYVMDTSKAVNAPNGFRLSSTFGSSSISGKWTRHPMGLTVTQQAKTMDYEYDYDPVSYKITYNLDGGVNATSNPSTYNILYGITLEPPTKDGYTFDGWYNGDTKITGINAGKNANFTNSAHLYSELETRQTGDVALTAKWKANPTMLSGPNFQKKLSSVTGFGSPVTSIDFKTSIPDLSSYVTDTTKWDVSEAQDGSIMAWLDGKSLSIGSNEKILANANCERLFYDFRALTVLNFNDNFDTRNVTNMRGMFENCRVLKTLDVSDFDTRNVTYMLQMFNNCQALISLDVSNFDTSNVTRMSHMFGYCRALTSLDVSNFDTSNVTDMSGMFVECAKLQVLDVSNFNTHIVTNTKSMFHDCQTLKTLDVSNFDMSNVRYISSMFQGCYKLEGDLRFKSVAMFKDDIVYSSMFSYTGLDSTGVTVYPARTSGMTEDILDKLIATKNTGKVKRYDPSSTLLSGSNFQKKLSSVKDTVTLIDFKTRIPDLSSYVTDTTKWDVSEAQDGSIMAWLDGTSLNIGCDGTIFANANCTRMFYEFRALTVLNFNDNFDTKNVTGMFSMFSYCISLTSLDLSNFNTINVINAQAMFAGCHALTSLNISDFDTTNVINAASMFSSCYNLEGDLKFKSIDALSNVTNYAGMFLEAGRDSAIGITVYPARTSGMTEDILDKLIATKNTGKVKRYDPSSTLLSGPDFQTKLSSVTSSATSIDFKTSIPDLSGYVMDTTKWDVSEAQDGSIMAWLNGTSLNIGSNEKILANPVSANLFAGWSNVQTINLNDNFDTSKVTHMNYMFRGCINLISLDVTSFNTSNVTNMYGMFSLCMKLTSLDVSNFDTRNVMDMNSMFGDCSGLLSLDLSNFDVSNVIDMGHMVANCRQLRVLDASGFNTPNTIIMSGMFLNCSNLVTIYADNWDVSNAIESDAMFYGCRSIIGAVSYNPNETNSDMANYENGYFTLPVALNQN